MDFSSILANEINAKKKDLKTKNSRKKLGFKHGKRTRNQRDVEPVNDEVTPSETLEEQDTKTTDEVRKEENITDTVQSGITQDSGSSSNQIPISSQEDTNDTNDEMELLHSISDQQLDQQLEQLEEITALKSLTKLEKIKHLQGLIAINKRKEKYKEILESESKYVGDSDLQLIDLQELETVDDHTKNHEVYIKIRVIIKSLIRQWEDYVFNHPYDNEVQLQLIQETKRDLVTLLYKLRSFKLSSDMLISLLTVLYYIQIHDYNHANESYMKLSIGNVAWPIGVEHIGIHARSSSTRINGRHQQKISNIMINDKTKRWITSIKRLITSQELINR